MASAESQGKTVALVIFVVLFVTASAFAYYFYNQIDTFDKQRAEAVKATGETSTKLAALKTQYNEIKTIAIGSAGSGADDHAKTVELLNQKLVNPNNSPNRKGVPPRKNIFDTYTAAIDYLNGLIATQDKELGGADGDKANLQEQLARVNSTYNGRVVEANTTTKMKEGELKDQVEQSNKSLEEARQSVESFQSRYSKTLGDYTQLQRNFADVKDAHEKSISKLLLEMDKIQRRQSRGKEIKFDTEDGEIVQIQGGGAEAFVNIGRGDGATEGLTFGIYGKDSGGFVLSLPKANLEIIRILGDNRSLGRILDYDITHPVVPGDKLFNPVWDRGQKTGIALLGIVDLDGDGRPDNDEFKAIVKRFGGKIDAEVDLKTYRVVGHITTETQWLVEGKVPEPAESSKFETADFSKMREQILAGANQFRKEARESGVRRVTVNNFLAFMGYRTPRRTYVQGEEDQIFRNKQRQATHRIEPVPGGDGMEDEDIKVRADKDAPKKDAKKSASKTPTKTPTKKKSDEDDNN